MPWQKNYSEADVLDRAMQAFWARGYEATSMNDLVAAMGINRGSIYSAFTDKRTLFIRALKHYDQQHRHDFLARIRRRHGPRDAILAAFEQVIKVSQGGRDRNGCLLVNTALELSPHDPEIDAIVSESLKEVELFFLAMIREGQTDGSIRPDLNSAETSQALLGLFLGMRGLSRSRPEIGLLKTIAGQAMALVG